MKYPRLFSLTALLLALLMAGCSAAPAAVQTEAPAAVQTEAPAAVQTEAPAEETPQIRSVLATNTIEQFIGDMTIHMRTESSYDEHGFLTEIVSYNDDQETSRTKVESDEHGTPIRQTTISGENTIVTESECTYDDSGRMIKRIDTVTVSGTVIDVREYEYTPEGKILKATFTTMGENGYTTGNSYEYDESGNQTAEIFLAADGTTARREIQYNEEGKPIRSVTTNSEGVVTVETDYIYLEDGSVKTDSGTSWSLTTYNEYDQPLVMETYNGDTLAIRITYTYITIPAFQ